ncbi:MAG: L-seryl-tRNA(Sec) selenium transferase, partial [Anaerolineae bacterium]|nr:L-seryl-tRNA(Sec) selenium transferase [Anaerolineae bacterium]
MQSQLRQLPSVDKLLQTDQLAPLTAIHGRALVVEAIRGELDQARRRIMAGEPAQSLDSLAEAALTRLSVEARPSLQPVINATGVIIHTNLGRALLSRRAQQAM